MKKWFKGQWLVGILISLCVLITFSPELTEPASSVSGRVSIPGNYQNHALPSIPLQGINDLSRTRRGEINRETATTFEKTASSGIYRLFNPNLCSASSYLNHLDNASRRGFQQACQLTDIPPPFCLIS